MEGGGGEKEIIYLLLHCTYQNDSRIKIVRRLKERGRTSKSVCACVS